MEGSIWIRRELAKSAVFLAVNEIGVVHADIEDTRPGAPMVEVRYWYDDPHLKLVIAKELDRKIRNLI